MTEKVITPLIQSYGRRRGRVMRPARRGLMETLLPKLALTPEEAQSWNAGETWMEIGFGSGEHLAAQAQVHPQVQFIGCEPYADGIGTLLKSIAAESLENIRIFPDDARLLMPVLPAACLSRVFILFPDPWPKARHHKRRLISTPFLETLSRVMKPGAELLLATDWDDYVTWMLEHLLPSPHFAWTAQIQADWTQSPEGWVRTKYQEKAQAEGRGTTYLRFVRK